MLRDIDILVLSKIKGLKKNALYSVIQDPALSPTNVTDLHHIIQQKLKKAYSLSDTTKLYEEASKEISNAAANGIQVITTLNSCFPERLKHIPNPPFILYVKGSVSLLNAPFSVAVVGTREVSPYGSQLTHKLSSDLTKNDVVIVSGLALGCDTQAHLGCLANNGNTIAVLAHGLDMVYPPENNLLAENILKNNGCLVSEYAPGVNVQRHQFLQRNRIQSGLSQATLIIETKKQGGTLTTAEHCRKQGRKLYCVQPSPDASIENFEGNKLLIETGAIPLVNESIENLLNDIGKSEPIPAIQPIDTTIAFSNYRQESLKREKPPAQNLQNSKKRKR